MPNTYVDYRPPAVTVTRNFDVEGLAPDTTTTEAGGKRTVTIRPRMLKFRTDGANLNRAEQVVDHISLEGRQVRKSDGNLGNSRVIGWAAKGWRSDTKPPAWILEILESEGLRYGDE